MPKSVKDKLANCKLGGSHSEESIDRISKSLTVYYREKYSVSREMIRQYDRLDKSGEASKWLKENAEAINADEDVTTFSRIFNNPHEIPVGPLIEIYYSDGITPEILLLEKEEKREKELDND